MLRLYSPHRSVRATSSAPASRQAPGAVPSGLTLPATVFQAAQANSVQRRFRIKHRHLPYQFRGIMKPDRLRKDWTPTAQQYLTHLKDLAPPKRKNLRKKLHSMNPLFRVPLAETEEMIAYYKYLMTTKTIAVDAETEKLREQQVENKLKAMETEWDAKRAEEAKEKAAKEEKKKAAKLARKAFRGTRTSKKAADEKASTEAAQNGTEADEG